VEAVGRLRPGVTTAAASGELSAIAVAEAGAESGAAPGATVRPMRAYATEKYGTMLKLLFGAVGLVLLIACANVANLLLVRAWTRQREFGIRTAAGAGRGRLARQLLTESLVLSLAGGALGAVVAWRAISLVIALKPPMMGFLEEVRIDPAALAFTVGLALLTGVAFGLAPALFAARRGVGDSLREAPLGPSGQAAGRRFRGALIVAEVALSAVLLVAAGLLVRSLVARVRADEVRFPHGLTSVAVELPLARYPSAAARQAAFDLIMDRVRGLPGVEAASLAQGNPWERGIMMAPLEIEGSPSAAEEKPQVLGYDRVQPDYFRAVGAPLLAGRVFGGDAGENAVVVSRAFSRRFFPSGSAVGARLRLGRTSPWKTVVGVVGDIPLPGPTGSAVPQVLYEPLSPGALPSGAPSVAPVTIVTRAASAAAILPLITKSVLALDSAIHIRDTYTATAALTQARAEPRFATTLLSAFAALALVLAAVGLYGVVAYAVRQRTHEIGVRVALGASAENILGLVLRHGLGLAFGGIAIGLAGAAAVTRLLRSQLYGIQQLDPTTFAAVAVILGLVALLASYLPARAALRVDPVEALRADG
jgi:predicted permease